MKDMFNQRQRYSLRKYSFGVASVLLGVSLLSAGQMAKAEEVGSSATTPTTLTTIETETSDSTEPTVSATPETSSVAPTTEAVISTSPEVAISTSELSLVASDTASTSATATTEVASEVASTSASTVAIPAQPVATPTTASMPRLQGYTGVTGASTLASGATVATANPADANDSMPSDSELTDRSTPVVDTSLDLPKNPIIGNLAGNTVTPNLTPSGLDAAFVLNDTKKRVVEVWGLQENGVDDNRYIAVDYDLENQSYDIRVFNSSKNLERTINLPVGGKIEFNIGTNQAPAGSGDLQTGYGKLSFEDTNGTAVIRFQRFADQSSTQVSPRVRRIYSTTEAGNIPTSYDYSSVNGFQADQPFDFNTVLQSKTEFGVYYLDKDTNQQVAPTTEIKNVYTGDTYTTVQATESDFLTSAKDKGYEFVSVTPATSGTVVGSYWGGKGTQVITDFQNSAGDIRIRATVVDDAGNVTFEAWDKATGKKLYIAGYFEIQADGSNQYVALPTTNVSTITGRYKQDGSGEIEFVPVQIAVTADQTYVSKPIRPFNQRSSTDSALSSNLGLRFSYWNAYADAETAAQNVTNSTSEQEKSNIWRRLVARGNSATQTNGYVRPSTDVVYYYARPKGDVTVEYYIEGTNTKIAADQKAADQVSVKETYDASTSALRPDTITYNGQTYRLVVDSNNAPVLKTGSATVTGTVEKATQTVQYQYRLVQRGSVDVTYKAEDGTILEGPTAVATNEEAGTTYSTTQKTFAGYTFKELETGSAAVSGTVVGDQTLHVVYVYSPVVRTGSVDVVYKAEDGTILEALSPVVTNANEGTAYTTSQKTFAGYTFKELETGSAATSGVVVGDQTLHVVYVYSANPAPVVMQNADITIVAVDADGNAMSVARQSGTTTTAITDGILEVSSNLQGTAGSSVQTQAQAAGFDYQALIAKYQQLGYQVVSGSYTGTGSLASKGTMTEYTGAETFDNDTASDQHFVIKLTPIVVPFEPNQPVTPGQTVPGLPNDPTYPTPDNADASDPNRLKETVTRTVSYFTEDKDGNNKTSIDQSAIASKSDTLYFRRTGKVNLVTGEVVMNGWTITDANYNTASTETTGSFANYISPVHTGFILKADAYRAVGAHTGVQATDADLSDEVIYVPIAKYVPQWPTGDTPTTPWTEVPYTNDPTDPTKIVTPTDPGQSHIPYVPGYTPQDPSGNPLQPVDPSDPTKGYIPPVPTSATDDTVIPYTRNGNVLVKYVDENGNSLKADRVDTSDAPVGTAYDTNEAGENPTRITSTDGKIYELVRVDGNERGQVVSGTTTVTYVYRDVTPKRGNVLVKYVSDTGVTLQADRTDLSNATVGTSYNTNESGENPTIITTADGSRYGKIRVIGNETGSVVEGDTVVTYVYTLLSSPKGSVVVEYRDEDGNVLKASRVDLADAAVGTSYNTNEAGENPQYIDATDGIRYELVSHQGNETGSVVEGTTTVVYIYRAMGEVVVDYVDENGNKLINSRTARAWSSQGTEYDTTTGNPRVIYRNGVRYEVERVVGQEKGKVGKGRTTVTYVYRKVEEPSTPTTPDQPVTPTATTPDVPGQPGQPGTPSTTPNAQTPAPAEGQVQLPETGDESNVTAAVGAGLLASLMAGLALSRKKKED